MPWHNALPSLMESCDLPNWPFLLNSYCIWSPSAFRTWTYKIRQYEIIWFRFKNVTIITATILQPITEQCVMKKTNNDHFACKKKFTCELLCSNIIYYKIGECDVLCVRRPNHHAHCFNTLCEWFVKLWILRNISECFLFFQETLSRSSDCFRTLTMRINVMPNGKCHFGNK